MYLAVDNNNAYAQSVAKALRSVLTICFALTLMMLSFDNIAHAEKLTDILHTKSFQGSWEWVNKFNWMGWLANMLISCFCILGTFMIILQKIITLLYLSNRPMFDEVWDIKNAAKGNKFFGVGAVGKDLYNGNRGVGFDVIIGFGLSLLPNIKAYSEYNDDRRGHNLEETDTASTYLLKTALPTILMITFFAIGFSGTLSKAYGMVTDGIVAAMDKAVTVNLEAYVNRVLSTGDSYNFTLGVNNSAVGKKGEAIAKDIYGQVLSKMDILDTESRIIVGKNVEGWVWKNVMNGKFEPNQQSGSGVGLETLAKKSTAQGSNVSVQTEADVSALSYDIIVNTNDALGKASGLTANIQKEFLAGLTVNSGVTGTQAANLNMHLIVRKDKITNADFFVVPATTKK